MSSIRSITIIWICSVEDCIAYIPNTRSVTRFSAAIYNDVTRLERLRWISSLILKRSFLSIYVVPPRRRRTLTGEWPVDLQFAIVDIYDMKYGIWLCFAIFCLTISFLLVDLCELFPIIFTHYRDVFMSAMASQIIGVPMAYSTVSSGADQRKHQSSASLALVKGIHRWAVNSSHKGPVTRKMFPFDAVIRGSCSGICPSQQNQTKYASCGVLYLQLFKWFALSARFNFFAS